MRIQTLISTSLAALLAACATPQGPPVHELAAEINQFASAKSGDVIGPGDLLSFQFSAVEELGQPDLSQQIPVQHDGTISLAGIGIVVVAGKTPAQLSAELERHYAELVGPDQIFGVSIAEQAPRIIHVLGSVEEPGAIILPPSGRLTLVQAFAEAGGVQPQTSYLANTHLVRWDQEAQAQVSWIIDARHKWWGEAQTVYLVAGDILYVPNTPVVEVNTFIDLYIRRMIPFPRLFTVSY